MKQKDIVLIIIIAFFSAIASYLVSNKLFVTASNRQQEVVVVDPIDGSFKPPDKKYFNDNSIDPAQDVPIGSNSNPTPFNGN